MMNPAFDTAVYIGRFQPFLKTHLAMLRHALARAPLCVVVIAGARQARSPRNPLTRDQRAAMISAALTPAEAARVRIVAVRDDNDTQRWAQSIRRLVEAHAPAPGSTLVLRDASCAEMGELPWAAEHEPATDANGETALRDRLLGAADAQAELHRLQDLLAPGGESLLRQWLASEAFREVSDEWQALRQMRAQWNGSPYTPIFVTVDAVVRCAGQVLLIQRGRAPGAGLFALPGGFLEADDTVLQSAIRELAEETGLDVPQPQLRAALSQVTLFDAPGRSQRGRVLTHAHYFDLGQRPLPAIRAGDDAAAAFWVPQDELASLEERFHDDHFLILDHFLHTAPPDDVLPAPLQ